MADFGPEKTFWGPSRRGLSASGFIGGSPDALHIRPNFGPGSTTIQPGDPAGYSLPHFFCLP
jgi:hypothetical protein